MSRPRTPALALASAAGAALMLSGCAAGPNAVAKTPYSPGDGTVGNSGSIRVLNGIVVAPERGTTGVISMTVVNRGDRAEELTSVTSAHGTVDYAGSRDLAPGRSVTFDAESNPSAEIRDLTAKPGEFLTLVLSFRGAEPLRLQTLVVPATGYYATVTPGGAPTATDTPADTATDTPADIATPTATGSASDTATPST